MIQPLNFNAEMVLVCYSLLVRIREKKVSMDEDHEKWITNLKDQIFKLEVNRISVGLFTIQLLRSLNCDDESQITFLLKKQIGNKQTH
jgi:hypothetical protein